MPFLRAEVIALIVQKLIPKMKAEDIMDFLSRILSGIRS